MDLENLIIPEQYDFIGLVKFYSDKLLDKDLLSVIWRQIQREDPPGSNEDKLAEYRLHLPMDLYRYIKMLEQKCSEIPRENVHLLECVNKRYFLSFIFYCSNRAASVTDKTKYSASTLYLKLALLPEVGKLFFNKNMYICQMVASLVLIKSHDIDPEHKETFIKLVKDHCLKEDHLDDELLAASSNVIVVSMIISASEDMIETQSATGLAKCCMKALQIILLHTSSRIHLKNIARRLFRCVIKRYIRTLTNNCELAVDIVILFFNETLEIKGFEKKIEFFLDAFVEIWNSDEEIDFKEVVRIINSFPEEQYKELLRKIITLTEPRSQNWVLLNIFKLVRELFNTPPNIAISKLSVLFTCLLDNVVHHLLNGDKLVSSKSVQILKEFCEAADHPIQKSVFSEIRTTKKLVTTKIEAVLIGLLHVAEKTWSYRNKTIFEIITCFIKATPNLHVDVIDKILTELLKDATPITFEPSFETLESCLLEASQNDDFMVAVRLMDIMHTFAMCANESINYRYASVSSFFNRMGLKGKVLIIKLIDSYPSNIFYGLLRPSTVKGKTYEPRNYLKIYISRYFDYKPLFIKCNSLIREQELDLAVQNLDYTIPSSAILLEILLCHYPYKKLNRLTAYVNENFINFASYTTSGHICACLEKVLRSQDVSDLFYPQLDSIQSAIMTALFGHNFPLESVKAVFSLYKTIREILKLQQDEEQMDVLLQDATARMLQKLLDVNSVEHNSLLYFNEFCLLMNVVPDNTVVDFLENCFMHSETGSPITPHIPDIYIQCLTMISTIAFVQKSRTSLPLKFLEENLNQKDGLIQIFSIKLLYSLSKEITHEFDIVLKFAFKEIVTGNKDLVRVCAFILEELVHDDYIKLNSEEYFKLIYGLGCDNLHILIKELLLRRFVLSNQSDIAQYYVQSIVYSNMYTKFSEYPISSEFYKDLEVIRLRMNARGDMLKFLFRQIPINKKFNILMEMTVIFETLVKGRCKVDEKFFEVVLDLIMTVRLMNNSEETSKNYYQNVIRQVEKYILRYDPNYKYQRYFQEYEDQVKRCTLALLRLLFFENEYLVSKIQVQLFDAVIHWVDLVKTEVIYDVHEERRKEYTPYFAKLVQFYRKNKSTLRNASSSSQLNGVGLNSEDKKNIFFPFPFYTMHLVYTRN